MAIETIKNKEFNKRNKIPLTLTVVSALVAVLAVVAVTAYADADTKYVPDEYGSIQAAINAASNGDTVVVNASGGPYVESISVWKEIDLVTYDNAVIRCPANPRSHDIAESTQSYEYPMIIWGGTWNSVNDTIYGPGIRHINVSGFTIDANNFVPSNRYVGILARNVVGEISDCTFINTVVNGKLTFGILGYGDNLDITINHNTINKCAKGNIGVFGGDCLIINNTVVGPGQQPNVTNAPNGIQISNGATGTVTGNDVSGLGWYGDDWAGTGILIVDTSNVVIDDNYVHHCEQAIGVCDYPGIGYWLPSASNMVVSNNTLEHNSWGIEVSNNITGVLVENNDILHTYYDGIDVYNYSSAPSPNGFGPMAAFTPTDVTIRGNTIECGGDGIWIGEYVDSSEVTIYNNIFQNNGRDVVFDNPTSISSYGPDTYGVEGRAYQTTASFVFQGAFSVESIDTMPTHPNGWPHINKGLDIVNLSAGTWVDVSIYYEDVDLPAWADENTLEIWKHNGAWVQTGWDNGKSLDTINNIVSANITDFGSLFVPLLQDPDLPEMSLEVGSPTYTDGADTYLTCLTPIWLNATDATSGAWRIRPRIEVYNEGTASWDLLTVFWVYDGSAGDIDTDYGEISYVYYFPSDCYHRIRLNRADDYAGNYNNTGAAYEWHEFYVDCTPGVTTKDIGTPNYQGGYWVKSITPITLTATDPGTCACGIQELYYSVDGGAWTQVTGDTATLYLSGQGIHNITWYSVDNLGNVEAFQPVSGPQEHFVDDNAPVLNVDVGEPKCDGYIPGVEYCITSSTPIYINVSDDQWPGRGVTLYYNVFYNGTWTNMTAVNMSVILTLTGECNHILNVSAIDGLGSEYFLPNDILFHVDDTAPPIPVKTIGEPQWQNGLYVSGETNITLHANDDDGVCICGLGAIHYIIDGGTEVVVNGSEAVFTLGGLAEGAHTIEYWAVDCLGNEGDHHIQTHYLDANDPETIKVLIGPVCAEETLRNRDIHTVFYFEDFDTNNGGYTPGGTTNIWEWGIPTNGPTSANSTPNCWGTDLDANYPTYTNATLTSIPIDLTGIPDAQLDFYIWYDTEFSYDGCNLKISTDGGSTWAILGTYPDIYDDDAAASGNAGIPYEPCWSGHNQKYWEPMTFDLSGYADEVIMLRWHMGSDSSIQYPGAYIDDVRIFNETTTPPEPPEPEVEGPYWITSETDICFHATDSYTGVQYLYIEVWWDSDMDGELDTMTDQRYIKDNNPNDLNPTQGEIDYCITLPEECYHEIYYYAIDYFGHQEDNHTEIDLVDNTPPMVEKTFEGAGTLDYLFLNEDTQIILTATDLPLPPETRDEDFINETFDTWLPTGWTTNTFSQSFTSNAGGTVPEAELYWLDASGNDYLTSPVVDTSGASELTLEFRDYFDHYTSVCYLFVEVYDGSDWVDVTPWANPVTSDRPATLWTIDLSGYASSETQIRFSYGYDYWNINWWDIDDVHLYGSGVNCASGVVLIEYRSWYNGSWSNWTTYWDENGNGTGPFSLEGGCMHYLQYRATDCLGHTLLCEDDFNRSIPYPDDPDMDGQILPEAEINKLFDMASNTGSTTGSSAPTDREEVWLRYDDEDNTNSVGLTAGGTFEWAIRLTPVELSGYDGYNLTTVQFHHGWNEDTEPAHDIVVTIYDAGTSSSPGSILTTEDFYAPSMGWYDVVLTTPVLIDASSDLWISCTATHLAGEYPAGCNDAIGGYSGKSCWASYGSGWQDLVANFGAWNIAGLVEGEENGNGNVTVVTLYESDFETDDGGWIPDTSVGDWEWTNTYDVDLFVPGGYTCEPPDVAHSGTGLWGTVMYGPYSNSGSETTLTQTFNFSGYQNVKLNFASWSDLFGDWDYGQVFVNGVEYFYVDDYHPGCAWTEETLNLGDYDGKEDVEIVFSVHASTVVNYAGWYIDDILITGETEGEPPEPPEPPVYNITVYNQTHYVDLEPPMSWIELELDHEGHMITPYTEFMIKQEDFGCDQPGGSQCCFIHFRIDGPPGSMFYWNGQYLPADGTWQAGYSGLDTPVAFQIRDTMGYQKTGKYTVEFYAEDCLGNAEETIHREIYYPDTTAPSTTLLFTGAMYNDNYDWITEDTKITLSSNDPDSGIQTIKYRIDTGPEKTYTGPFTITGEGLHTIQYYAEDMVNHKEHPNTHTVMVDSSAPESTLILTGDSYETSSATWITDATTLEVESDDPGCGVDTIYYRRDGGAWETYQGSFNLAGGSHIVEYYAVDKLGNTGDISQLSIGVDTTAPSITYESPRASHLYIAGREIMVLPQSMEADAVIIGPTTIHTTATDTGVGIKQIELYIDGELRHTSHDDYLDFVWNQRTFLAHTLTIKTTDHFGHTSSKTLRLWVFNI